MTTYNDFEISEEDGNPYFLYEFTTDIQTFRYIDAPEEYSWNSQTWEPLGIVHSTVNYSSEMSKNSITVRVGLSTPLAQAFLNNGSDHDMSVTLRRGHYGSPDTIVYWKGRVTSHVFKNKLVELKCESLFTSMKQAGLRARYQRACRHSLYSDACGVDKDLFSVSGLLTASTGIVYTIAEAATKPDGWFSGGMIQFADGSLRMIANHVGDQISLSRPSQYVDINFPLTGYGLDSDFVVTLFPGCNRTLSTCKNKFDNILNQGGFKWIPGKNPFGGSSIV